MGRCPPELLSADTRIQTPKAPSDGVAPAFVYNKAKHLTKGAKQDGSGYTVARSQRMNALKYLIAFAVAPLFFLAAAVQVATALRSPERRSKLMRQGAIYSAAGVVWLLFALILHT
jgi:hypothetical protein